MDARTIHLLSFVKSSKHRKNIILFINNKTRIPSEIASNFNLSYTHTSKYLNSLREEGLVACLNEKDKRGRLYQLTKDGLKILEILKENDREIDN